MMACITARILLAKQFNHTSRIPIFQMALPFGKLKPSLGLFFIIESVFTLSIIGLSPRKGEDRLGVRLLVSHAQIYGNR